MNFARNAILTAIIFQMTHATFPIRSSSAYAADTNRDLTAEEKTTVSTSKFIDTVMDQEKELIKIGCIDEQGVVTKKYRTDAEEIQKDDGQGIDCYEAVKNYLKARKHALELMEDQEDKKNSNCADCGLVTNAEGNISTLLHSTNRMQDEAEEKLHEGKDCKDAEKAAIQVENKSCSYSCGLKNAAAATLNSPIGKLLTLPMHLMFGDPKIDTSKNCPIPQGNTVDCIGDIFKTLMLSAKDLVLGTFNKLASAASWVGGLFSAHKEVEAASTTSMLAVSGMDNPEVVQAKSDHGKGFLTTMKSGLLTLFDFFSNYKELGTEFDCVHCKDKLNPLCKVIGLVGRDVIIMWLTGKLFKAMGPIIKRLANKTKLSRLIYRKGAITIGRISKRVEAKWASFKTRTVTFGNNTLGLVKKSAKKVSEMPSKIRVVKSRALRAAAMQDKVLREAIQDAELKAASKPIDEGVKSVEELVVGMDVPGQKLAMDDAVKEIVGQPSAKLKAKTWLKAEKIDGMKDLEPVDFTVKEQTLSTITKDISTKPTKSSFRNVQIAVSGETSGGKVAEFVDSEGIIRNVPVDANKKLVSLQTYRNAKGETNAVLGYLEGEGPARKTSYVIHTEHGLKGGYRKGPRVSGAAEALVYDAQGSVKIPVEKAALLDEASGNTIKGRPTEEVRIEAIEENLKANRIVYTKNADGTIDYEAPNNCGNGSIDCTGKLMSRMAK